MPRKPITRINLPAIAQVEAIVARFAKVERATLFSTPQAEASEVAINIMLVALRDFAKCPADDILKRYTFLTRASLMRRLYDTYVNIQNNPQYSQLYDKTAEAIKKIKEASSTR